MHMYICIVSMCMCMHTYIYFDLQINIHIYFCQRMIDRMYIHADCNYFPIICIRYKRTSAKKETFLTTTTIS